MNRKSRASTPMVLRSGCRGDCVTATGKKKAGHHHHHHSATHHYISEVNNSPIIRSSGNKSSKRPLTRDKSPYQNKRIVKASSTPSKDERSLNRSSEEINSFDCSVQLEPIVKSTLKRDTLLRTKEVTKFITTSEKKETVSHLISSLKSMKAPQTQFESIHKFALMPSNVISSFKSEKKILSVEETLPPPPLKEYSSTWIDSSHSSVYKRHGTKPHYSDYSSGEELELNDTGKTDYTYAWSASYNVETGYPPKVPSPNMSRRGLHSSGNSVIMNSSRSQEKDLKVYNTSEGNSLYNKLVVEQTLHDVAQSLSNQALASGLQDQRTNFYDAKNTQNTYYSQASLTYGLDSESDDEEFLLKSCRINSQTKEITTQTHSLLSLICNIGECVFPVQTLWHKSWSLVYRILCSVLLWDSWILSRGILKPKWLWFLLLLLPFLLLGGLKNPEGIGDIIPAMSSTIMEAGSFFAIPFTKAQNKEKDQLANKNHEFTSSQHINYQTLIANIKDIQQTQVSRPEVEDIVRFVIRDEILGLSSNFDNHKKMGEKQAQSLLDHDSQLSALQAQMRVILTQSEILGEELRNTKEKIIEKQETDHGSSIKKLNDLEMELDSLKDNIHRVHETQALLLANMRNCCRNNTFDPALVENQIALMLLQIMGKGPKPSNVRSEFMMFLNWLNSSFVGPDDLNTKLNITAEKVTQDINQDVINRVEMVAKSVAIAAVKASLQHQQEQKSLRSNASIVIGLNENEVRQIIQDALMLYDADKTGQADFALETGGGSIISTRCSETYHSRTAELSMFGIPLWFQSYSPRTVIQPGVHPGECWAFKGSEGYLVIQLSGWVQPSAFSLEHIPRSLATNNLDSAPKNFSVYGLKTEKEMEGVLLGKFVYDIKGEPLQYFIVEDPDVEAFPIVELRIHSNHGNLDYTCLYRFRVHGKLVKH